MSLVSSNPIRVGVSSTKSEFSISVCEVQNSAFKFRFLAKSNIESGLKSSVVNVLESVMFRSSDVTVYFDVTSMSYQLVADIKEEVLHRDYVFKAVEVSKEDQDRMVSDMLYMLESRKVTLPLLPASDALELELSSHTPKSDASLVLVRSCGLCCAGVNATLVLL